MHLGGCLAVAGQCRPLLGAEDSILQGLRWEGAAPRCTADTPCSGAPVAHHCFPVELPASRLQSEGTPRGHGMGTSGGRGGAESPGGRGVPAAHPGRRAPPAKRR